MMTKMPILAEGYLTTEDLIKYVLEKHGRHWNKSRVSVLLRKKAFPTETFGRKNIFNSKDIDEYIATISRPCASGVRGIKYKD